MKTTGRKEAFFTLLTALIILTQFISPISAARSTLTGTIRDQEGTPIPDTDLHVLTRRYRRYWSSSWSSYASTTTNIDGEYTINLDTENQYLILITHKTDENYNKIPAGIYLNPNEKTQTEDITLQEAATIKLDGLAYFIENTAIPDTTIKILETETNEIIHTGDLGLTYGTHTGSLSSLLEIPHNTIYIPTGTPFRIEIQSYIKHREENIQRTIILNQTSKTPGETHRIDLRTQVLPESTQTLQTKTSKVEILLTTKEEQGFFLAVERQHLTNIQQKIESAETRAHTL